MPRMGSLFRIWLLLFLAACASAETVEEPEPDDGWGDSTRDAGPDALSDAGDAGGKDASPACSGVVCKTPPTKTCEDADNLRLYEAEGSCVEGACEYPSTVVPCPYGCADGACSPNPCEGVTCNGPPANECVDATTIRAYSPNGTCGKDGCKYTAELLSCAHGCSQGKCNDDPCVGVTCVTPPDSKCDGASYLITYAPTGTCGSTGNCVYEEERRLCQHGCKDGVCNGDPCVGITCATPPASYCQDEFKLVTYEANGTCSSGICTYKKRDPAEHCKFGCDATAGKCKADPCLGILCKTPPADYCIESTLLRQFSPSGTCSGGSCSYTHTDVECPCQDGVCKDCLTDDDCETGKFCNDNSCTQCRFDEHCGDSCTDCTASGDVCNASSGTCAECVSNGHCAAGSQCNDGACEICKTADACGPSCAPCGDATPHCLGEGVAGRCVECRSDADCTDGKSCNPTTNTCGVGPLCQAALDSVATSLGNSASWRHQKTDSAATASWNYDFWQYGKATSGPGECRGGANATCWATNLSGNYINCQRADLRTPSMNLSACADEDIKLVFWHWYDFWTARYPTSGGTMRYDGGLIELSGNGGTTWVAVAASDANYSGTTNINPDMGLSYACAAKNSFYVHNKPGYVGKSGGWQRVEVTIPPELRTSQLMVRFAYASGVSSQTTSQTPSSTRAAPGWYIDGVTIAAP